MPSRRNLQIFLGFQSTFTFQDFREKLNREGDDFFLYADPEDQELLLCKFADNLQVITHDFDSFYAVVNELERRSFQEQSLFANVKARVAFNRKSLYTVAAKISPNFFELEQDEKERLLENELEFDFLSQNYRECALFVYLLEKEKLASLPKSNFHLNYLKWRSSHYCPLVPDISMELMLFFEEKLGSDFFCLSDEEKKLRFLTLHLDKEIFELRSFDLAGVINSFNKFIPKENTQLQLVLSNLISVNAPYEFWVYIESLLGDAFFSLSFVEKEERIKNINFNEGFLTRYPHWFITLRSAIPEMITHPQLSLLKYCMEGNDGREILPLEFFSELTTQLPLDFFSIKDKVSKTAMIANLEFNLDFLLKYYDLLSIFILSLMKEEIILPENKMYIHIIRLMFPVRFSKQPTQVMLNEVSKEFVALLWSKLGESFFSLSEEDRAVRFLDSFSDLDLMTRYAKEIQDAMLEFKIKRPMFDFFLKIAQKLSVEELTHDLLDFMMSKLQPDFFACDIEEQRGRFETINWFDGSIKVSPSSLIALLNIFDNNLVFSNTALGFLKWIDSPYVEISVVRRLAKNLGEDFFFLEQAEQDNRFQACMIDPDFIQAHKVSFSHVTQTLIRAGFRIPNSFLFPPRVQKTSLMQDIYSEEMIALRENPAEVLKKKREYDLAKISLCQLKQMRHDMQNKYIIPELGVILYPISEERVEIKHNLSELEILDEQSSYLLVRKPQGKLFLIQKTRCVVISIQHAAQYERDEQLYEETGIYQHSEIDIHFQQRYFLECIADFFKKSPDKLNTDPHVIELAKLIGVDFFYLEKNQRLGRFKEIYQRRAQELYALLDKIDLIVRQPFLPLILTQDEIDVLMQSSSVFFSSLRDSPVPTTPDLMRALSGDSPASSLGSPRLDSPLVLPVFGEFPDAEPPAPLSDAGDALVEKGERFLLFHAPVDQLHNVVINNRKSNPH